MQSRTISISRSDEALNRLFKDVNQYVAAKTGGAVPEWTHIPHAEHGYLIQAYIDWYSSYVLTLDPHASQITKETMRIRLIAERALDSFVSRFLRLEPVTDLDRINMGIPNEIQVCLPQTESMEVAEFENKLRNIRKIAGDLLNEFFNKSAAARKNRAAAFR